MPTQTYTPIARQVLASTTASVTFNSFSGYTDLVIITNAGNTSGSIQDLQMRINGDTGGNYSQTTIIGDGASATSNRTSNGVLVGAGFPTSTNQTSVSITQFQNYSNSTTYKAFLTRGNHASTYVFASVGTWRSTNAITSISLFPASGSFTVGSTLTLYGIKAGS